MSNFPPHAGQMRRCQYMRNFATLDIACLVHELQTHVSDVHIQATLALPLGEIRSAFYAAVGTPRAAGANVRP